jgi:NAD(P)-dependent dehydrogenase (short-subunit alcohol dehydrogenase family)
MEAHAHPPRVAVVTGAGSGIGAAVALDLARTGLAIACVDIELDRARDIADRITAEGGRARALRADVAQATEVAQAFAAIDDWGADWGAPSVVASIAGIVLRKDLASTTVEDWDRTMAVNVRGAFLVAQAAMPRLAAAGGGSLIMVASVVAHIGFGLPAYTASKGALVALTRELAGEFAHLGIRVNAVSPGTVAGTRVTQHSLADPAVLARTTSAIPLGRVATTDDVAATVRFLASPGAAMITGQTILVDGGLSASVYAMQRPRETT